MNIIRTNIENLMDSPLTLYRLTKSREAKSVNKLTDAELDAQYPVDAYAFYEDKNNKDESVTILSILSGTTVLVAQSSTFQRSFEDILDCVGNRHFTIRVLTGTSKNGRRYMDCDLCGLD